MNLFVILILEAHILLISEIVLSEKLENKIENKKIRIKKFTTKEKFLRIKS
jgi:hypothetical protein